MVKKLAPASSGLWGALVEEFTRAVEDVRHRVVEEGWFGKKVTESTPENTPRSTPEANPWEPRRGTFEELWGVRPQSREHDPAEHDRGDLGMDL